MILVAIATRGVVKTSIRHSCNIGVNMVKLALLMVVGQFSAKLSGAVEDSFDYARTPITSPGSDSPCSNMRSRRRALWSCDFEQPSEQPNIPAISWCS